MRQHPHSSTPSSFDGSAFFDDTKPSIGESNNEFFEMSKFESFMDRNKQKSRRNPKPAFGNGGSGQNLEPSPRSDDGMSFVSRKKHDNYANVVMEMKRKQFDYSETYNNHGQQQQEQQQQRQSTSDWDNTWSDFGNNHFQQNSFQQQPKQQQSQQQQRFFNDPPAKFPAERTGRKLYRDPNSFGYSNNSSNSSNNDSSNNNGNNNATDQPIPLTRSRSTVRRTVDAQRKLAQTYITQRSKGQDDDEHSEAGSVVSSVFLGNSTRTEGGSTSWEKESFRSFGSFGNTSSGSRSSALGNVSVAEKPKRKGLDALLGRKYVAADGDNCSVVSGTSVAARRRAKAALKNSPARNNFGGSGGQDVSKCAPLQPPPSAAVGARRNMRMRMQNKQPQQSQNNSPFGKPLRQTNAFNAFQLDSSLIDDEVNSALNELKLDHPDLDFAFDRVGSCGNSVDSSVSGRLSGGAASGGGNVTPVPNSGNVTPVPTAINNDFQSPVKTNIFKKESKGRHSPVTVGSLKTLTTKSLTVEGSLDSNTNNNQNNVLPSQRLNNNLVRPNVNTTPASSHKLIISPNVPVISVEQFSESVERCSESSSLTDTSDWHHSGHGGSASGTNMFKDAKGSTFHKSKRIVRVGESISESSEKSVTPKAGGATASAASDDTEEEEKNDINENSVMPSIKDRISQFKNNNTSPSHHQSISKSMLNSSIKEESSTTPREKSSIYSASSSTVTSLRRNRSELPPAAPTSTGQSPIFQVKLRKTNVVDNTDKESDGDNNAADEGSTASNHNSSIVEESSNGSPNPNNGSPNPFLSNVKLRSTGNSWRDKQQVKQDGEAESDNQESSPGASSTEPTRKLTWREQQERRLKEQHQQVESSYSSPGAPSSEPTKKLTYREQQELLRKEQQEHLDNVSSPPAPTEPKKLTWREQQELRLREQQEQTESSNPSPEPTRKLSYREQQELLRKEQEEKETISSVKLRSTGTPPWMEKQLAKVAAREAERNINADSSNDSTHGNQVQELTSSAPPPEPTRKLTYREQQELLSKEQQEQETPTKEEEPKKDVATLIRERIAMNKQQSNGGIATPSPKSSGSEVDIGALRGNLKKTSYGTRESMTPTNRVEPLVTATPQNDYQSQPNTPQNYYHSQSNTPRQSNSTFSRSAVPSTQEDAEVEFNPKHALNSMLSSRLGQEKKAEPSPDPRASLMAAIGNRRENEEEIVDPRAAMIASMKMPEEKEDPPADPRAALMSSISMRAVKEDPPADPRAALMASISMRAVQDDPPADPPADPRAALMASISKRAAPEEEEAPDPKANLAAMLQNRIAASTPSKAEAKSSMSSMLANRTPQSEVKEMPVATPSFGGKPALKDDPKYVKYFKMLKVGMPLPAVQHAMTRDGLDPSIMECDHNKPAPEPTPQGLPMKDDPEFAKYFKMLKLGMPMGAVKNAMERDGLDSSLMDGNHNLPASALISASPATKKRQKDTHRRTRLHWDTLVGKVKSNTVWALVNKDEELDKIVIDETEFTSLFQAELTASCNPAEKSNSSARNVVQVIDPKRANNGGIILARLRMSYDDMAKAVERIDETAMTANQAQGIVEYMPTLEERKKLRDYMKSGDSDSASKFEKLCECEKFMVAMMTVKQSKRKLRALLFKLQFRGCIHDLARDVFSIEKACDELSASVRLRKLFGIVLNIGNRLNTAGPGEKRKAGAFSIRSLLKLNQAKAFDNKTTFLHYVVLVVQRNSESLLDFKDDLPTALKADKIYWDQCVNELEEVETQLENVRKLALHEAKASKLIYHLPKSKQSQEDHDSDELSVASISLEEEVALLRSTKIGMFALSAIKKVSQLRERVDIAKDKFCQLLEYFGEDGDSSGMQPHELFEIITTFCRNFDAARQDVTKMEKAKKRGEKKEDTPQKVNDGTNNTKQTATTERTSHQLQTFAAKKSPMLRSSACQPSMSNVLNDLKRAKAQEAQSTTAPSSRISNNTAQHSGPHVSKNDTDTTRRTLPQCTETPQVKVKKSELTSPSQLLNHRKYPHDEPSTPARSSPIQPQGSNEVEAPSSQLITQQSSESEVALLQGSTSEMSAEPEPKSDAPTTPMSRRERRERARSRSSAQSKTRSNPQSNTAVTSSTTPKAEPTPKPEKSLPQARPTATPTSSNASARAAARDRYARHKKMMHQRHAAS